MLEIRRELLKSGLRAAVHYLAVQVVQAVEIKPDYNAYATVITRAVVVVVGMLYRAVVGGRIRIFVVIVRVFCEMTLFFC